MHKTGVFITAAEYDELQKLLQPTIQIDLRRRQNIIEVPPRLKAMEYLNRVAVEHGLPELSDGKGYGLAQDREIIAP